MMKTRLKKYLKPLSLIGGIVFMIMNSPLFAQNLGALHDAVEARDYAEIEALVKEGQIDINVLDFKKQSALMLATQMNDAKAAELLIAAGADVNAKNNIQDTPYLLAGAEGYNDILVMAIAHGAKLEDTNRYGGTAIIPAAEKGYLETIKILLNAGVNPNHINNLGWTALMEAVILGDGSPIYVEIVDTLIKGGADPNIPDKKGVTPLKHAKARGLTEMQALLESVGAQ